MPNLDLNSYFNFTDGQLDSEDGILMVGTALDAISPQLIKMDLDFETISSVNLLESPDPLYRTMDFIKTDDGDFIYCSSESKNSFMNVDIQKFDQNGDVIWNKEAGIRPIDISGVSVTEAGADRIAVLAENFQYSIVDTSYFLFVLDKNGDVISEFEILDSEINKITDVVYSEVDNSILILGGYGVGSIGGAYQNYLKISKYSLEGNLLSSKIIDEEIDLWPSTTSMKLTTDGNVIVYYSCEEKNQDNFYIKLHKLDTDFDIMWEIDYADIKNNLVEDIIETKNGDFLILSSSSSIDDGEFDVVLTSLNANLDIDWIKSYGTTSSDQGGKVLFTKDQSIIIIGNSNHNGNSDSDFKHFVLHTDSNGVPL